MSKGNFIFGLSFFGLLSRLAKTELIYGRFVTTADRMRKLIYICDILLSFFPPITGYQIHDCRDLLYFHQLSFGTGNIFAVLFV